MELFRPDRPVDSQNDDKFQRYPFAKRIAEIVSNGKYPKSLVIGIYGKWGEGKTSVLNFIHNEISSDTVVINFNPWQFSEQKQLLKSFFESVAQALGKKLTTKREKIAEVFGDYSDSIASVAELIIPHGIGAIFKAGKKVSEKFKKDSIEDLKIKVDSLIIEANCNFVIFIDDIDRLDVSEIQSVFKLVKLVGDFPRTSYILSFDDDMVASALGPQYASRDKSSGYAFLEKIIQIPLHLPKANKQALRNYTLQLINNVVAHLKLDLKKSEVGDFIKKFDEAFVSAIDNPRLGVRFANSIGFSAPLLSGEVHISDLMIIEGIKAFYPELYHLIRNNGNYFLTIYNSVGGQHSNVPENEKKATKDAIDEKLSIYEKKMSHDILNMLLDLFPQLKTLYRNYAYMNETYQQWYREKRICSPYYFERYFSYVVKEGDISDVYYNQLFGDLENVSSKALKARLDIELPKIKSEDLIFKIQQYVPSYNQKQSETLARALVQFGNHYPNVRQFFGLSTKEQTAYIVEKLLWKTPAKDRLKKCLELLELSTPFEFTMDLQYRFRIKKQHILEVDLLQQNEITKLSEYLVSRFENESKEKTLFEILSDYETRRILNIYVELGRTNEAKNLLATRLSENCKNSLKIIKVFTDTIKSTSKPEPYKTNFTNDSFHEMEKFVDLVDLYNASIKAFGNLDYIPVGDIEHDELTDENLVALFQKMYSEKLQDEKLKKE